MPDPKRWASMTLAEQMANTGSEVGRSAKWIAKGKLDLAESAYLRALDLIDLTLAYGRQGLPGRKMLLKELCRARDCYTEAFNAKSLVNLYYFENYFCKFAAICRNR